MAKKSWIEKQQTGTHHKVEVIEKAFADMPAGSSMLVATPNIVADYINQIPKGHSSNVGQMRKDLAAEYGAEYMCPLTAGIFLRIAAEAAWEEMQQGKKPSKVTPFWRIISPQSATGKKLSFGTSFLADMRRKEGIEEQGKL
jgi:hypothetical protein